jgi:hypothetical protein
MVNPGTLPLAIIRGIEFPEQLLQCKDENAQVSIDGGAESLYLLSGWFGGYELFILPGASSWFLYYNQVAASYVIAQLLTTGALTNYFLSAGLTEATGSYTGQGSLAGHTAVATDHPVDLTNYTVEAVVRRNSLAVVALDLNPSISDAVNGEITIPAITSVATRDLDLYGTFRWDLVLINGAGERFPPPVLGPFTISDNITQKAS